MLTTYKGQIMFKMYDLSKTDNFHASFRISGGVMKPDMSDTCSYISHVHNWDIRYKDEGW
jgi:hypothetical protein